MKWEDIINKDEAVVLNSTPVKSTTSSVTALGTACHGSTNLDEGRICATEFPSTCASV